MLYREPRLPADCVGSKVSEDEKAEVPFLSLETLQLRRDNAARRAESHERLARRNFNRRHEPALYGAIPFRRLAKIAARSARIARFWHRWYAKAAGAKAAQLVFGQSF